MLETDHHNTSVISSQNKYGSKQKRTAGHLTPLQTTPRKKDGKAALLNTQNNHGKHWNTTSKGEKKKMEDELALAMHTLHGKKQKSVVTSQELGVDPVMTVEEILQKLKSKHKKPNQNPNNPDSPSVQMKGKSKYLIPT